MKDIKNFRKVEPSAELLRKYGLTGDGEVFFLESEDGQDWYECQQSFADDTVKIMYDASGIVVSAVVDPVGQREGTRPVSMFWPDGFSVAEVAAVPDGFESDGKSWKFLNGEVVRRVYTADELIAQAQAKKASLLDEASAAIAPLERAVKYGVATDAEKSKLEEWERYSIELSRVDVSKAPDIEWPEKPEE